ncbi:MAG: cytoskeleton protein RodZ [Arsenophonus sp. ET-YP4-MAG3]
MNSNTKTEKIEITVGQRLSQARAMLNLSREIIAERLCLKICTIREIEEDNSSNNVDPTFLRGYIRSYAKLVKIPEKEILELLDKHTPAKVVIVSPMQSYSLGKIHKKWENWIIKFTWLIIIICIIMIGIWWWQGYKVQKQEIFTMSKQIQSNSTQVPMEFFSSTFKKTIKTEQNNLNTLQKEINIKSLTSKVVKNDDTNINIKSAINPEKIKTILLPNKITNLNSDVKLNVLEKIPINNNIFNIKYNNEVAVNFKGKCWLEIRNTKGKILFSGIKNLGQTVELNGELSYRFNIGIPANVTLFFRGNYVDLNRFIKANRPASFKLPEL